MRVAPERRRDDLLKLRFDVERRLTRREAGTVADAEDMRVDRERFLSPGGVEDDIGGLAADAGQGLELFARARDFPAMVTDQRLAERDHILRLGVEQADGLDCLAQGLFAEIDHRLRSPDAFEQVARGKVDAGVGRLSGEHDRDQQGIGVDEIELRSGRGVGLGQALEELENLLALHSEPITSRIE